MLRLEVSGMTCGGCARSVTRAVQMVPGVTRAMVDLEGGAVKVDGDVAPDAVAQAIERAGFTVARAAS